VVDPWDTPLIDLVDALRIPPLDQPLVQPASAATAAVESHAEDSGGRNTSEDHAMKVRNA
jgi:hypothetical protein